MVAVRPYPTKCSCILHDGSERAVFVSNGWWVCEKKY